MQQSNSFNLLDQLIVSMPTMTDPIFEHTIIYICEHNAEGAIGLILNRPIQMNATDIFQQMNIKYDKEKANKYQIMVGGPMQPERGFVLHSPFGKWKSSLQTGNKFVITTSKDILEALAIGEGPEEAMIVLGYSSWDGEQLIQEIMDNAWINCPATRELIFDTPSNKRWAAALNSIGINHSNIQSKSGHA